MSRFDAIVIGAGINGLAAAATLARAGKSVCVLEQAAAPGGMATLRLDDGPELAPLLWNLSPVVLKAFNIDPATLGLGAPLPAVALDPGGAHIVLRGGWATSLSGETHADGPAFQRLHGQLVTYGALLRRLAEAPPPGGGTLLSQPGLAQLLRLSRLGLDLKRMGKPEMRRFLQVLLSNAYDLILDEMPDGPLAGLLAADAVRGNATGPRSPGSVFTLIYRMGHGGEVRRPEGGMPNLIRRLDEALQKTGCTIRTGTPVARIILEDDRVTGVETKGGEIIEAPRVLSSLGPKSVLGLTGAEAFDIEAARRIRHLRTRGTVAKVNLRLTAPRVPGLPDDLSAARLVYAPSADYVEAAFTPSKYGSLSEAPVIEATCVAAPDGRPWLSANVQYAPADLDGGWDDAACDRLRQITLDTLARALPDLPGAVEELQVIPPTRIAAETGAAGGHWHHAELALDQIFALRPGNGMGRYAMGPRGLYLCGASTHPGGDVMGLAGRNAAAAVLEGWV
ncbi:phytoene desaturase family protein [Ovoidimarina sediminis]|uniref:phytoene desaturase family protein n=1 Tax=Ovoidimarina sediminis TaxID=3079856 RepID=UPI0029115F35|nr:NAD(P)/FAD-dependent oxidoreductase [Rhodophyticola sp. MJ-SS7]MDU8943640.1 NAD(P)/FAD-dependent oxidoreductase [Rhodophyticola sp. MJ-SS7]